jgi:hypothetical protein
VGERSKLTRARFIDRSKVKAHLEGFSPVVTRAAEILRSYRRQKQAAERCDHYDLGVITSATGRAVAANLRAARWHHDEAPDRGNGSTDKV